MSKVQRRKFLTAAAGVAALSLPVLAQQAKRVRQIGFFSAGTAQSVAAYLVAFREGMLELRWVKGRDYVIEARYASGGARAAPDLIPELVASGPDLLLTTTDENVRLLAQRTRTIPIVFAIGQDPVGNGVAASLQRPGGNATGLTSLGRELSAKRLQLLKEAFPRVAQAVLLYASGDVGSQSQVKETEDAAARLGIRVTPIGLAQAADIESAFKRGAALGTQAYIVASGYIITSQRQAIAERVLRAKVPGIFQSLAYVQAGGLMSYGPLQEDNFRRAAGYVDKILKGTKPGDLPIEQPTKFELIVNMKTAKAMGFTFPESFMVRVDRVIE